MRILVVSNMYPSSAYPNYGIFVKNFINICVKNSINVEKVYLTKQVSTFPKIINYILYYIKIFLFVLFKKYDLVYVHYAGQNSLPIYFLRQLKKVNLIMNVHGSDIIPEKSIHKRLLYFTKKVLNKSNKIVVPSEYYKLLVNKIFDISLEKIYVYPSAGIDPEIFYSIDKKEASKGINITPFKKTIGYISRMDFGKGWDTLLEAIKILKDQDLINNNEYQFVFVGDGKESEQFKEKVQQYQIGDFVIHYPFIEQKSLLKFYNSFDVFCFPTRRESESLGLVAIEALACGIPVIASDYAAPAHYIKEGFNGLKFKVNSAIDLSLQIENFFKIPEEQIKTIKINAIKSSIKFNRGEIRDILIKDILGERND